MEKMHAVDTFDSLGLPDKCPAITTQPIFDIAQDCGYGDGVILAHGLAMRGGSSKEINQHSYGCTYSCTLLSGIPRGTAALLSCLIMGKPKNKMTKRLMLVFGAPRTNIRHDHDSIGYGTPMLPNLSFVATLASQPTFSTSASRLTVVRGRAG